MVLSSFALHLYPRSPSLEHGHLLSVLLGYGFMSRTAIADDHNSLCSSPHRTPGLRVPTLIVPAPSGSGSEISNLMGEDRLCVWSTQNMISNNSLPDRKRRWSRCTPGERTQPGELRKPRRLALALSDLRKQHQRKNSLEAPVRRPEDYAR